ncbi:MAG: hypothetical protein IKW76_09020 [Clostridia bacterium]|nr:hypothetical protein [Clostridia bacterium]
MNILFVIGLVCAAVTALLMPYYCKITYSGKDKWTLTVKMLLSSLFFLTAILSLFSHEVRQNYLFVMLAGFLLDYIGDYILGKEERTTYFVAGSCCFAVGHILYIIAVSMAEKRLFPQVGWWNGFEAGIFLTLTCVMLAILLLYKPAFDPLIVPMFVYCMIAALMLSKLTGLAVRMFATAPALILMPIGGVCFLLSDYMLGMMRFKMHKKTFVFKSVCTASYYVAQTLIALSMFTLIQY